MSKRRDDQLLLEDILECIQKTQSYTKGMSFDAFTQNELVVDGVVRNLEIIGEAATVLSKSTKAKIADVPWHKIKGLRNRIIHEYFDVSYEVIWFITQNEMAPLKEAIQDYLKGIQ